VPKIAGVYPVARPLRPARRLVRDAPDEHGAHLRHDPLALRALNAGIIDQAQFSVLVTVVVLTAILPTILAQRWFTPPEAIGGRGRGGADA
jgi:hypothetical protein